MKLRWIVILGVLSFVATLVLHTPAASSYTWLFRGAVGGDVGVHGIEGTLSTGRIGAVSVNGRPLLSGIKWELRPAWLLLLRLSADVETGGDAVLRANVSRGLFGNVRMSGIEAAVGAKALLGLTGQATLPVEGKVRVEMPSLLLDAGAPVHAEGGVEVLGLAWTLAREPLLLGDFNATVSTDDKGIITAAVASGAGPLELSGEAILREERAYDLHLQLKPRPDAGAHLQTLIRSLGQPDAQGWYHIRRKGTL